MSRIRFQSKLNGRRMLTGNWMRAIIITFLLLLLLGGVTLLEQSVRKVVNVPETVGSGVDTFVNTSPVSMLISGIFVVVLFLFTAPLKNGQAEWYWKLVDRKETPIGDVFGWYGSFRLYGKSILLGLHILWRMVLWAIPVYAAPGALLTIYALLLGGADTLLANLLLVLGLVLFVFASLVIVAVSLRYFPARYLLVEDSKRTANDCVRTAARYSKGFRWEIIKFQLSFLLWWLLCYLIFPAFYVMPYYNASSAVFARHIIFTQRAKERQHSPAQSADTPSAPSEP
ncbi:DUF975 family protein [Ethanoligenens sp.]|uniref:DUF975 family protein n=1 Tax=Ethanoligenens sp. TaxID=2099655 RepID=UPI0039EC7967